MKTQVLYLNKSMIIFQNLNNAIYVPEILKVHHVKWISLNQIDLYYNLPFQQEAEKLTTVTYVDDGECSDESDVEGGSVYLQNTMIWRTQLTVYQDA